MYLPANLDGNFYKELNKIGIKLKKKSLANGVVLFETTTHNEDEHVVEEKIYDTIIRNFEEYGGEEYCDIYSLTSDYRLCEDELIKLFRQYTSNTVTLIDCKGILLDNYDKLFDTDEIDVCIKIKSKVYKVGKKVTVPKINEEKVMIFINILNKYKTTIEQKNEVERIKRTIINYMELYDLMLSQKFKTSLKFLPLNRKSKIDFEYAFKEAYKIFMKKRFPIRLGYKTKVALYSRSDFINLKEEMLNKHKCNNFRQLVDKYLDVSLDVTNIEYFVNKITKNKVTKNIFNEAIHEDNSDNFKTSKNIKSTLEALYFKMNILTVILDSVDSSDRTYLGNKTRTPIKDKETNNEKYYEKDLNNTELIKENKKNVDIEFGGDGVTKTNLFE